MVLILQINSKLLKYDKYDERHNDIADRLAKNSKW